MPEPDVPQQRPMDILKAAAVVAEKIARTWGQKTAAWTGTAAVQCNRVAHAAAEVLSDAAHKSYEASAEAVKFAGRSKELIPVAKRYYDKTCDAMEKLKESEALQLRRLEDLPSFADYVARLGNQLDALLQELRCMPRPAVATAVLLLLRLLSMLNGIVDAAIYELLHGRTVLSKLGLLSALVPGWLAIYHYRCAILQDLHVWPERTPEATSSTLMKLQWHTQLARNLRRMPPAFWLATCMSGTVGLQITKEVCSRTIQGVLRLRLRLLLIIGAIYGAASCGVQDRFAIMVSALVGKLPPNVAEGLKKFWGDLQMTSVLAAEFLLRKIRECAIKNRVGFLLPGLCSTSTRGKPILTQPVRSPALDISTGTPKNFDNAPVFKGGAPATKATTVPLQPSLD